MAGEKKRLFENFLSLGALQIISYVIPLITLPYLSRVLGVEKFGLVFFAQAFVQYFITFTEFGFGLSGTREVAVNRHNQNNLSNIFNSVITIKMLLMSLGFIVFVLCIILMPRLRHDYMVFLLSYLMVFGNLIFPSWFFQGMERMKYITFLNVLARVFFLILIFIFVKSNEDYMLVPFLNSIGTVIAGVIGFWFAVKEFNLKLYIPKFNSIKKQFIYSSEFFLSSASVTLFTNTNTFFLGLIGSNTLVAYYVAADKIYTAVKRLVTPVYSAIYPYVAKYRDLSTYFKYFKLTILAHVFICLFVFLFAKGIISVFYGIDMLPAYIILRIFTLSIFIVSISMMLGYPFLGALGYTRNVNTSVFFASIFHITGLGILYFTNLLNIYSMASLVILTETFILVRYLYFIRKYKLLTIIRSSND